MFKDCFFPKKKVVVPKDSTPLLFGPITAIKAKGDASKIRKEAQDAHDRYMNETVIPRIWEMIHNAKSHGDYVTSFDDNYFQQKITHEDFPFISQYFQDPQYKFKVRKESYNYNSGLGVSPCRPDFCIEIRWDMEFKESLDADATVEI
jgi:hypothetical protein